MRHVKKSERMIGSLPKELRSIAASVDVIKKTRLVVVFVTAVITVALLFGFRYQHRALKIPVSLWNHKISKTAKTPTTNVTVFIVLGEKLLDGANPSDNLHSRIRTAQQSVVVHQQQRRRSYNYNNKLNFERIHVIFSGGDTARVNKTEANVMKELWDELNTINAINYDADHHRQQQQEQQQQQLHSNDINLYLEKQSLSTCQNAFYSIPIIEQICNATQNHFVNPYSLQQQLLLPPPPPQQQQLPPHQRQQSYLQGPVQLNIIVVTSDYHVARTRLLFEQVFTTVTKMKQQQQQQQQNDIPPEQVLHHRNDDNNCIKMMSMVLDVIAAPTTASTGTNGSSSSSSSSSRTVGSDTNFALRQKLFQNERYWLQPETIKKLLYEMKDHPFLLPTTVRLQQARHELDRLE